MTTPRTEPVRPLRLRVASPCTERWEDMVGNRQVRFCGGCQKHVYNLSEMTAEEARRLVDRMEGKLCAIFWSRSDGTVLTSDCPVGERRVRRRRKVVAAAAGAMAAVAGLVGAGGSVQVAGGIEPIPAPPPPPVVEVMGDVAPVPEPPPVRELGEVAVPELGRVAPPRRLMGGVAPRKLGKVAADRG